MIYQNIIFIVESLFEVPSLFLLILITITLQQNCKNRNFSSTFYQILFWSNIIDIISYLTFTFHHRFPNYGILIDFYYALSIKKVDVRVLEFLRNYTIITRLILTFLLSLNRFTAVTIPIKHKTLWKKYFYLVLLVTLVLTLILTLPLLLDQMCYTPQDSKNILIGFRAKWFTNNCGWYNSFLVMTTLSLIFLSLSTVLNIITFYFLIKLNKKAFKTNRCAQSCNDNGTKNENVKKKLTLFVMAFISFLGQLIMAIENYVSGVFNINKEYDKFYVMVMLFPIVHDLTIFPETWLLLIISKPIRKEILLMFLLRRNKIDYKKTKNTVFYVKARDN
uniref:Serpentine receptor class gamma n=1 Tax=Parastrongyloides trichosuri TaxID=131310 RepID=A0A0N4ZWF6_PARTI